MISIRNASDARTLVADMNGSPPPEHPADETTASRYPTVLRLELVRRSKNRVRIVLDDDTELTASLDVATRLELFAGAVFDPAMRRRLEDAQQKWDVRQDALNLLSYRPRSEHELRTRLRKKEHTAGIVEWCVHELRIEGLLDDLAFATAFARSRLTLKPRGRRKLLQELAQKGIRGETAARAIDRAFHDAETTEHALAFEAGAAWLNRQPERIREGFTADFGSKERETSRRRLLGYLERRGFPSAAVRAAVDAAHEGSLSRSG